MATKHPDSDNLRQLADWLDQHGDLVETISVYSWLAQPSPERFRELESAMAVKGEMDGPALAVVVAEYDSLKFRVAATARSVGATKRTVTREVEEYVIGDAA